MRCANFVAGKIRQLRIAVIGDVMLDRYFYGEVTRISPEAPVPVNRVKKITSVLGGAANVAANLANLGCHVFMGGVTGVDENRLLLEKMLAALHVNYEGLIRSKNRSTITKMRILGACQQMLRLDFEEVGDLQDGEIAPLKIWLEKLLQQGLDGIAVSDYAKGVCSDDFCRWVIATAAVHRVPVLVDPKGANWEKYQGCTFITPNLKEMGEVAGVQLPNEDEPVLKAAQAAKDRYHIQNVIVTRSERGMTLVGDHRLVIHSPATALDVFDVSGAGDTAAAAIIAAAAGGLSLEEVVYMANRASGIVVGKVGTYPVHRDELLADLLAEERRMGQGYRPLSWDEVASLVKTWHAAGESVVFTNGCFDILHVGHISYLEQASRLGRHLIIGLNSDSSAKKLKGKTRPLVSELDRARLLSALACVGAVVIFEQDTPAELIKLIRPDILVKGGDYKPEEVAGREYAGKVQIIRFEEGYSTTGIVQKIVRLVQEGKL